MSCSWIVVSESGCGIASANNLSCLAKPQVQFHYEVRNAHKRVGSILVMTSRRGCCSHVVLGATKVTFLGVLQQKPWTGHLASVINSQCLLEGFHFTYSNVLLEYKIWHHAQCYGCSYVLLSMDGWTCQAKARRYGAFTSWRISCSGLSLGLGGLWCLIC